MMDKEKIGLFISSLRKEKKMTQKEMAEKINITDKAISKWERGLSLPDISMLEPLSQLFDVSVMELLQGERIKEDETVSLSQMQNILDDSINLSKNEIEHKHFVHKNTILMFSVVLMFLLSLTLNIINSTNKDSIDYSDEAYSYCVNEDGKNVFVNTENAYKKIINDIDDKDLKKMITILYDSMEGGNE